MDYTKKLRVTETVTNTCLKVGMIVTATFAVACVTGIAAGAYQDKLVADHKKQQLKDMNSKLESSAK